MVLLQLPRLPISLALCPTAYCIFVPAKFHHHPAGARARVFFFFVFLLPCREMITSCLASLVPVDGVMAQSSICLHLVHGSSLLTNNLVGAKADRIHYT